MSTFTNTGSSLKSTNKPAALLELAHALANAERLASTTELTLNNVSIAFDLEGRTASITASLPLTATIGTSGAIVVNGFNYIGGSGSAFTVGTGELKSTHLAAAFLELVEIVNLAELAVATNPPNNVSIALDLEGLTAAISASLPLTTAVDGTGKVVTTVVDYLP